MVVTPEAVAAMRRDGGPGAGRGRPYPRLAVETCVLLMAGYGLTLRAACGFVDSLLVSWGVTGCRAPSPSTVCRRRRQLRFVAPAPAGSYVLLVDATGVSIRPGSGWRTDKPGATDRRRGRYVKWHAGIDAASGQVVTMEVTAADGSGSGDVSVGPSLIREAPPGVRAVIGDGAYDSTGCYEAARDRGAVMIAALPVNARYGTDPDRDQHLAQIGRLGPPAWKARSGYHTRSLVEALFSATKACFTDRARATTLDGARAEVVARVLLYNRWLAM